MLLGVVALASRSLKAVNRRTLIWGVCLQFALAYVVIRCPEIRKAVELVGCGVGYVIRSADAGGRFVFGSLASSEGPAGFVFAFRVLPPILFVSSLCSVLYHLRIIQALVGVMARIMMYLMRTSGAETLSVAANVFMGMAEAPLIVRPYIPRMTRSELLALMASGMAHISGGMMVVYISYGADPASILCACVMACPCSLYLTKLIYPESGAPETFGAATVKEDAGHVNIIDAAASGVKDGLWLALNVAAMLIVFLAFIHLANCVLAGIKPALVAAGVPDSYLGWWPNDLSLESLLGRVFGPLAFLIGVDPAESERVGSLLGIKLATNEHVAFLKLKDWQSTAGTALRPLSEPCDIRSGWICELRVGGYPVRRNRLTRSVS